MTGMLSRFEVHLRSTRGISGGKRRHLHSQVESAVAVAQVTRPAILRSSFLRRCLAGSAVSGAGFCLLCTPCPHCHFSWLWVRLSCPRLRH